MSSEFTVYLGLVTGLLAVVIWSIVFVRGLREWSQRQERRATWMLMAGTALLASIGTLSSSIGYGMQTGVIYLDVPQPVFSFIASMGRGALIAAGLIILTHARPPKVEP